MTKQKVYLAFDIGASSGRAVAGWLDEDPFLHTRELYRFENGFLRKQDGLYWDHDRIFGHILEALKVCKQQNLDIACIGIDTWGQDTAWINSKGLVIDQPHCYRDPVFPEHADEIDPLLDPPEQFYGHCGTKKGAFSTLRQLFYQKNHSAEKIKDGACFLFMPYLFIYLLTGQTAYDNTLSSIGELADVKTGRICENTLKILGMEALAPAFYRQGTIIGYTTDAVCAATGYDSIPVACVHSHDTSSAIAAIPDPDNFLYISSGTWSMCGAVTQDIYTGPDAFRAGLCNCPLGDGRNSLMHGTAGMFVIQQCMKRWKEEGLDITYPALTKYALSHRTDRWFRFADIDDTAEDMPAQVIAATVKNGFAAPNDPFELYEVFANSLARLSTEELALTEQALGKHFQKVYIVGGGSQAEAVNVRIAEFSQKTVYTGNTEASSVGNLLWQMIACDEIATPQQALEISGRSFPMKEFC